MLVPLGTLGIVELGLVVLGRGCRVAKELHQRNGRGGRPTKGLGAVAVGEGKRLREAGKVFVAVQFVLWNTNSSCWLGGRARVLRKMAQVKPKSLGTLGGFEVGQTVKVEGPVVREPYLRRLVDQSLFETAGAASCCVKVLELVAEVESVVEEVLVQEAEIAAKDC